MGNGNYKTMKKLLLIGGTGGIGTELAKVITGYDVQIAGPKDYDVTGAFITNTLDADIVINLAALTQDNLLAEFHPQSRNTILTNCFGAVNVLTDFLPLMGARGWGRIILMSSIYSTTNVIGQGVYSATKAFIDRLVKIAAIENACNGVTINSIQLGYTGIGMGQSPEIERAINKTALKRLCTIDELWQTIQFIIDTEYLTGQNIRLDGGMR